MKSKLRINSVYVEECRLYRLDGRTRAARFLKDYRRSLIGHLGNMPSVTEKAVIERAAILALKCAQIDGKILNGADTECDSRTFLAWSNALTRLLERHLGLKGPKVAPPSLAQVLGEDAAE
jgi:hypothetical protein